MELFSFDDRNPYMRANSLDELCSFYDVDFVRCAYITILGRQPDPSGEAAYLRRLRAGANKLSILNDLRRSSEGKSHDPGIAGLDRALRKQHHANLPFVGWFIRQLTGRAGHGPIERSLRMLESNLAIDRDLASRRFAHLNHYVEMIDRKMDMLENMLRATMGRGSTTPSDIADSEGMKEGSWELALHKALDN